MPSDLPDPPAFEPCPDEPPPVLPDRWHAVALLTPFSDNQLLVVEVTYDWTVQAMRLSIHGLEEGYLDLLIDPTGAYVLTSEDPGGPVTAGTPAWVRGKVPSPSFLRGLDLSCLGRADILDVGTSWWMGNTPCTNGYQNPSTPTTPQVTNIFWTRSDNGLPWRMMFINQSNDYELPILGEVPMVHLPTFEALEETDLPHLRDLCDGSALTSHPVRIDRPAALLAAVAAHGSDGDADARLARIQELIPGLQPPPPDPPMPAWPERLYMTAMTTPTVEPLVYPTQVYYDWTIKRMLTRFTASATTELDTYLTDSTTYLVRREADGGHTCLKTLPVGLLKPDWPTVDGGVCRGVITDNPQLSPGRTTQIFVLPTQRPRFFWIWYTIDSVPVLFLEVPQLCDVMLVLTDYSDYVPDPPPWEAGRFDIPADCLDAADGGK